MAGPNDIQLGIRIKADAAGASAQFQQAADGVGRIKEQLNGAKMGAAAYFEAMQRGQSVQQGSTNEAQKFVEAMKREAETLGFTALQLKAYKASKMELTDAQALSVAQSLQAMQAYEKNQAALKGVETQTGLTASAIGMMTAAWAVAGAAVLKVAGIVKDYVQEATQLYARNQQLGVVMEVVGRNAGYNATQMQDAAKSVQGYGIGINESREAVVRMAQAQIDLTHANKLAALAYDAATISNTSASEAMTRLMHGIVTAQPEVLRAMGLTVNFEQAYKGMARQLGVTTEQLAEHEKLQARLNETYAQGNAIIGAGAAAKDTAAKQMKDMERAATDLKMIRGEVFNDALLIAVGAFTDQIKDATKETQALGRDGTLKKWGREIVEVMAFVADAVDGVVRVVQIAGRQIAAIGLGANAMGQLANTTVGDLIKGKGREILDTYHGQLGEIDKDIEGILNKPTYRSRAAALFAGKDAASASYAVDSEDADRGVQLAGARNAAARAAATAAARAGGGRHGGGKNEFEEAERWVESLAKKLHGLEGEGSLYAEVVEKIVWGTVKLTKAQELQAEKIALEYDAKKALEAQNKRLMEQAQAEAQIIDAKAAAQARGEAASTAFLMAQSEAVKGIQFETELLGINGRTLAETTTLREKATAMRKLENDYLKAAVQMEGEENEAYARRVEQLTKEYELRKQLLGTAIDNRAAMKEAEDIRKKQLDENARMVDDISRSVGEALQRGSKSGIKGMMDDLKEAFRKAVFRVAVQPYINAAVSGVAGLLGMALPSTAGASGGGGTGSLGLLGSVFNLARGLFSGGSGTAAGAAAGGGDWVSGYDLLDAGTSVAGGGGGLLSGFSGLSTLGGIGSALFGNSGGGAGGLIGGLSGMVNGGFQSLGVSTGSQFLADIGNFGYGMPVVGAALQLATGNYAGAAGTAIGAAIGSVVPVIGTAIGALVGSLIGSLVGGGGGGGGPAQNGGYDFTGMVSRSGLSGSFAAHAYNSKQQFTVQTNDWMGGRADALINDLFDKFERAAKVLGADPAVIRNKSYSAYFKTMDTSDNAQVMAAVQAGLGGIAEQMAKDLIPNIEKLKNANESLIDTFARLANEAESKKLTDIFNSMGAAISLQDATRDLFLTELSPLTNAQRLAEAGTRYGEVLTKAQGGDTAAFGSLAQFSRTYLGEARNFYASSQSYTDIFNRVQSEVNSVVNDTLTEQSMQFAQMGLTLKDIEANTKNLDQRIADAITRALEAQATTSAALAKANTDTLVASQQASTAALQAAITALSTAQVAAANSGTDKIVFANTQLQEALAALRAEQAAAASGNAEMIAAATAASARELQEAIAALSESQVTAYAGGTSALTQAIDALRSEQAAAASGSQEAMTAATAASAAKIEAAIVSLSTAQVAAANSGTAQMVYATVATTVALNEALDALRAEQMAASSGNAAIIAAATAKSTLELQQAIDAMRAEIAAAQTSGAGQVSETTQAAMEALRLAVESLQAQHTAAVNASAGTITEATKASTTALVEALTAVVNVTSGGTGQVTSAITDLRDAQVAATQTTATSLKAAIEALPTATAVATESALGSLFYDAAGTAVWAPGYDGGGD